MKNRVIKKIMAYLLVGAMVITTPMTASATESVLQEAYNSDNDGNKKQTNTNTNTSTNTSGGEITTPVPDVIQKHDFNILGIAFDKEALDLEAGDKDTLHVRVLLDDYDANDEELSWESLSAEDRNAIESQIHWVSLDHSVATARVAARDDGKSTDGIIEGIDNGQTEVIAWIEADGKAYEKAPNMPTDGDLTARATVTVRGGTFFSISFDNKIEKFVNQKRTYDLRKYTNLTYKKGPKTADETSEKIYYSITPVSGTTARAKCTEDGLFTISKAAAKASDKEAFSVTAVTESGLVANGTIKLSTEPVAAEYTCEDHVGLDYAEADTKETKLTITNEKDTTDDFEWKAKSNKIVDVKPSRDGRSATVIAKGVGTTDITVKSTSDKKAKVIKVFVNATPEEVTFSADNKTTYTGKPMLTNAIVTGKNQKVLPAEAFTYTWKTKNATNATIKKVGKLNEAKITPKNVLEKGNIPDSLQVDFKYTCTLTYKHYDWVDGKVKTDSVKNLDKQKDDSGKITIKQSNVADITVQEELFASKVQGIEPQVTEIIGRLPNTKSETRKTYVGKNYRYAAKAYVIDGLKTVLSTDEDLHNSISWSISGKAATIDDNGNLTPVAGGKANITASYISLKYKNGKATAQVKKKIVPIQIVQNATAIGFKKPVVVVNPNDKRATQVSFKISNVAPKKATYNITSWKVIAVDENGNDITDKITEDGYKKDASGITIDAKDKNGNFRKDAKITIPKRTNAKTVIKVAAYTDGGVMATGYIYVTEKTKKVEANTITVFMKDTTTSIVPKIIDMNNETHDTVAWIEGKKVNDEVSLDKAKPVSYEYEPVTYSLDKTAAKFIRVTRDGKIIPLQVTKASGVKVTIKTLSGKSCKVTVVVNPEKKTDN